MSSDLSATKRQSLHDWHIASKRVKLIELKSEIMVVRGHVEGQMGNY